MSRLAVALNHLTTVMTISQIAEIIDESHSTAGRWVKSLREDATIEDWSAAAIEKVAAYEARAMGTTTISDALLPDRQRSKTDAQDVRAQSNKANRRNASLMSLMDGVDFSKPSLVLASARLLLEKTESAIKENEAHLQVLHGWRQELLARLQPRT